MKKRILAALLALIMLFGALPMSVFAENVDADLNDTEDNEVVVRTAPAEGPNLSDFGFVWRFMCNDQSCDDYNTMVHQTSGTLGVLGGEQKSRNADGTYTVYADESAVRKYINKTNELKGYKFASSKVDAVIEWNETEEKWQLQDTPNSNTIYMYVYVDHTNVDDEPHGIPSELQTNRYITFACLDTSCTSSHSTTSLKITDQMYSNVSKDRTVYRLRFDDDAVKQAIEENYTDHEQAIRGSYKIYPSFISWNWKDGKWVIQEDGWPDEINAYMKPKKVDPGVIPAPSKDNLDIANLNVFVKCGVNGAHSVSVPYDDGTYTIKQEGDTAWLTFDIASYLEAAGLSESHALVDPTAVNPQRTFKYDAETRKWKQSGASNGPQIDVICKSTLTYEANGSNVKNMPKPVTQTLELPNKVTQFILSNKIPERIGYTFLGWNVSPDAEAVPSYTAEDIKAGKELKLTTGNTSMTLYAIWEESTFLVRYHLLTADGNGETGKEENVPTGAYATHKLWEPEKTGYEFTGWYEKASEIGVKGKVRSLSSAKKWELYGNFTPVEYTITYDYRDKDIADKNLYPENAATYTIEDTVTLNPITKNGMFGKTFLEWRCDLDKDGVAEKITEIPAGTTGDLTVYAYWNYPVSYTVYDEDDNEVEAYCETINVPEDDFGETYKPKSVEKDGYEFDGWYQNPKNFGNPSKRTETLEKAKNWKLYGKLKYVEKPVYVYVQPTYKDTPLTQNDAKAVAALARLGFKEGFNAGGKFVTLGKLMTAKTDVAGMVDEIDNGKLALYSEIDTTKFNEHVLNSIGWYGEDALEFVTNSTHKCYEADGKIDAYHLNGTMSFQSVTIDAGTHDTVENMPADGYYLVNDHITLGEPTREGYIFLGWSAAQDTPVITANPETDGEPLYPADHEWTVIGDVTFTAVWEPDMQTVQLVIYRNGDMTKEFKTVALDPQPKGTVIDLTKLNIADYYTANYTGKYDFYGWFNDGAWNEYKKNPERAGLDSITVNGWTNIICMVYDYEKVAYFMSDEDRVAGKSLFATTARKGAALPTADAPTATRDGYTFKFWSREGQSTDVSGQTVNGWTNLVANWEKKSYNVVAKLKVNGELAYDPNNALYTQTVSGKFEEAIDFASIEAWALDLAEKTVHPDAASYTVEYEDGTEASLCSTYGQHEIDQETHTIYVNVKTTEHVYVYRMVDGVMQPTEYHHSTAPFGANVVEHLNANVTNLDMPGYSHDEWFMKDVPSLDVKFGDTDTIKGWTNVVIKYTKNEFPVTYDYACTDPALVPNWKGWETLPENPYTYAPGESVRVAMMPDDVEDGEYIWKFVTWKLNGVDVVPNAQVPMVEGGLTFVGIWERTQKEYGVTYSYDPSLPDEVQATIPKNPHTYTVGQMVTTAAKPDSVRVGEYIWTFKTWKLNGVEVAPNTQVEMVSGGLHFEGIWETKLIHYSLTIQYVDKKGKELAESHMDLLSKGEAYKVDSPKIKGYKLKEKEDAVIEGKMPGHNLTIEVVYVKKSTGGGSGTIDSPNKPTTKAPALTLNTDDHFAFINGYPDGSVQPEGNVTRAETAAILYRIMGDACQSYYKTNSSSYSDVARGDWYNTYVATLENAGVIVDTRTNGKFRPNDAITRAELASMIAQFAGLESASAAKFNDVGSRYWAAEEIAIAAKMGWINGYPDGSFRPDRNVTRAELMAMVNRALGRTPKSEDDLLSGMKTWRDNANVNAWYYLDVQEATNDHTYTKSGTHETWKKLL